jgi:hypothetical protein
MTAKKKKPGKPGRPKKITTMTPEERLAHDRALANARQKRRRRKLRAADHERFLKSRRRIEKAQRDKLTPEEKKARRIAADAACYDWARIHANVVKRADGCWEWTGQLRVAGGRIRPIVRVGSVGAQPADHVVCCLAHGRPPPRCFVRRTCTLESCVAPEHLAWSNRIIERALGRGRHDEEELARGFEQRRREVDDAGHAG